MNSTVLLKKLFKNVDEVSNPKTSTILVSVKQNIKQKYKA